MGIKTRILASGASEDNAFNIGLLGFKMAVNEGLTVFNLIDGVVDEFNDESGTDEAEGSNDLYNATDDYYINSTQPDGLSVPAVSAGFTTTSITEPDTSTANTNPTYGAGTVGTFTVPSGVTSVNAYLWGSGGGSHDYNPSYRTDGGGGGFASGVIAVTGSQVLDIDVGEGGVASCTVGSVPAPAFPGAKGGKGGGKINGLSGPGTAASWGAGGGGTFIYVACMPIPSASAPQVYMAAGSGGGSGYASSGGGAGGGLIGDAGETSTEQVTAICSSGGGGDQEQGGQGGSPGGQTGGFLQGGGSSPDANAGSGGAGYYGGGGAGSCTTRRAGGGGSSYYGHPQISCGATEEGAVAEGGGTASPFYVCGTNEGGPWNSPNPQKVGEDGYVLLTAAAVCASVTSTTIVSASFTSTTVPTSSRIVVFEENIDSPTLNTDIIASVSRDGTNFTNATLSDSGYVTGSSGQRILTGQADISGQPSGQSMRWKLQLANNTVKIHGVSLQWS
jgi:hypothetical protein